MLGQSISIEGKKYNIIILAGGNGSRMGEQSDYIPKALSQIGSKRAIDYIIERYTPVAHKFIVGTCKHADLLETYIKGRFPSLNIEFSRETELVNNAVSTIYCLDHADSKYGTIITFCDLLIMGNDIIEDDTVSVVTKDTRGIVGTFRHTIQPPIVHYMAGFRISRHKEPVNLDSNNYGVLGHFVLENTKKLKSIAYSCRNPEDLTWDFIKEYGLAEITSSGGLFAQTLDEAYLLNMNIKIASTVYEFGTENDLNKVRELWEDA